MENARNYIGYFIAIVVVAIIGKTAYDWFQKKKLEKEIVQGIASESEELNEEIKKKGGVDLIERCKKLFTAVGADHSWYDPFGWYQDEDEMCEAIEDLTENQYKAFKLIYSRSPYKRNADKDFKDYLTSNSMRNRVSHLIDF